MKEKLAVQESNFDSLHASPSTVCIVSAAPSQKQFPTFDSHDAHGEEALVQRLYSSPLAGFFVN